MCDGAEREYVPKRKRTQKKLPDVMMPNLSDITFKDALTTLLKTPATKEQLKKHAKASLDKSAAEAKKRFIKP